MSIKEYPSDFWDCFWSDYPEVEFEDNKKEKKE